MKAPKDRQDYEFEPKTAKDFEVAEAMERLQNSMGGMGKEKSVSCVDVDLCVVWSSLSLFFAVRYGFIPVDACMYHRFSRGPALRLSTRTERVWQYCW